jgi:glycosyltransferase involved in cell wall biosynthesis
VKISVVILVCDRGGRLVECIQSVLDQSHAASEIILVDTLGEDGYVKGTISQLDHPVVKRVFPAAGDSSFSAVDAGVHASSGEIICFLDANDRFQKEKLEAIAVYFRDNPSEYAVCHAHFIVSSSGKPLSLWRPTAKIVEDILLGTGLSLSDLAVRRSALQGADVSQPDSMAATALLEITGRLLLSGVVPGIMNRPLGECREVHSIEGKSLTTILKANLHALDAIFTDPRCPEKALGLREAALAGIRLKVAYEAFINGEDALGRELLRTSIYLDRSVLDAQAYRFFLFLIFESIRDGGDHPDRIQRVFDRLPPEMKWMTPHQGEVIARGFVLRGLRALLWGGLEEGKADLAEAIRLGCRIDPYFFYPLAAELMDREAVAGHAVVDRAVDVITPYLEKMSAPSFVRWFKGEYFANRAFREFDKGQYSLALRSVQQAMFARPDFVANRGLLATGIRSLGRLRHQTA